MAGGRQSSTTLRDEVCLLAVHDSRRYLCPSRRRLHAGLLAGWEARSPVLVSSLQTTTPF